jgi:hypothetical protein
LKEFSASSYYRCEVLRDPVALEARRSLPAVLPPDTRTPQEWLTVEKPSQIAPVLEVFDEMGQEMVLYEDLKSRGRLDEAVIEWLVAHDCLVRWSDAISVTPAGRTLKASLRLAGTQAGQKTGTMMDHAAAL